MLVICNTTHNNNNCTRTTETTLGCVTAGEAENTIGECANTTLPPDADTNFKSGNESALL